MVTRGDTTSYKEQGALTIPTGLMQVLAATQSATCHQPPPPPPPQGLREAIGPSLRASRRKGHTVGGTRTIGVSAQVCDKSLGGEQGPTAGAMLPEVTKVFHQDKERAASKSK